MSTKSTLILIGATAVLVLGSMGAARFISAQAALHVVRDDSLIQANRAEGMRVHDLNAQHSEALARDAVSIHDLNAQHSEALAQEPFSVGEWYGAIPQTSALFNQAEALRLRDLIERHGEALQEVAP